MEAPAERTGALAFGRPIRHRLGRRLAGLAVLAIAVVGLGVHKDITRYNVTSGSMEPTLRIGDRFAAVSAGTPRIGEIVVFHPPAGARRSGPVCGASGQGAGTTQACGAPVPQESSAVFVKRVVAGPGDLVAIVDGHVVLNGVTQAEPYIEPCHAGDPCNFPTPVRVPAGEYYLLGDNRGDSDDSRFWGPVPSAWIIGTAVHCALLDMLCHPLR